MTPGILFFEIPSISRRAEWAVSPAFRRGCARRILRGRPARGVLSAEVVRSLECAVLDLQMQFLFELMLVFG